MTGFRHGRNPFLVLLLLAACGDGTVPPSADPAELLKVAGDGQAALTGTALPESIVVRVLDANGDGIQGITVSWAVIAGGGSLAPAGQRTDGTGRLAGRWSVGPVGPQVLQAGVDGLVVTFNATATSTPPPTQVLDVVAEPGTGQSGVSFSTQPSVQLENNLGAPIGQAGVVITASIASGSGFASLDGATTATTNAGGLAVFSNLGLTGPVGNYTLGFSASGFAATTSGTVALSTASGRVPLVDMGSRTYQGFTGGLYANGSNTMPAGHASVGAARARNVVPRGTSGSPNANGRIVLMSVGMSNTTQEWCDIVNAVPCNSWSFTGQAAADNAVEHSTLRMVDGAKASQTAGDWADPASPNYDRIRDSVLAPLGLTEAQVQVIWLKVANADPSISLPAPGNDAVILLQEMGDIVRNLAGRYPNLQMIFVSSRSYAGYATIGVNPEPYAYESGFAVKWLIQAQIDQMANGGTIVDARAGDLNYTTGTPWLAWGPYFWADGTNPRSDGLTYLVSDYEADGTHPSTSGETKIGGQLLSFFKTDTRAACWFLAGGTCP